MHRYDVRWVMVAGLALWGLATAATGLAGGFVSILVLRLVLGLGESVMFPTWQLVLARGTTEAERGRANGIVGAGQGVGPMIGTLFGGLAMASFGWRALFIGLGVITLLWLWPWLSVTRGLSLSGRAEASAEPSISYRAILRQRAFWGSALGHFSSNYAFYFLMTWLPTFLVKAGGFTVTQMATIASAVYGVYALMTAVAGIVSDRWIRGGASPTLVRKGLALACALGCMATIGASAVVEPRSAVPLLVLAGFFCGLGTPTLFAMITTLAGPRAAGRWAGAQNVAGQVAGVVAPLVTGAIVDRTGSFSAAFMVSAAVLLLAVVSYAVIIERVETVDWSREPAAAMIG